MTMFRFTRYFLVTTCFIALGVIVYRYSRLENGILSSKVKVYSFNLGKNEVTMIQHDGVQMKDVKWTKDAISPKDNHNVNEVPTHTVIDTGNQLDKPSETNVNNKVTSKQPTVYKITMRSTSVKVTEKPTTKPLPTTKKATTAVATTEKAPSVNSTPGEVPACSPEGEKLVGALAVDQNVPETEKDIDNYWDEKGWVLKGGAWRPTKCQAVSKVAIVIPYRNRDQQLKIFLRHMHPMLKRQLLDYRIVVVEQAGDTPFNRAMLFNIGYKEALKFHDFKCFIFHDVDLIPESDRNYYGCPMAPRHLSVAIDKFNYRLPYKGIFGGAGAFRKEDFEAVNGFSNKFWGWGGEDDDLFKRITAKGFKLTRPSMVVGRYKMVKIFHKSAKADPLRFEKLRDSQQRMVSDGLNSLKYKVQQTLENPLYTKVTVEVNPREV